MKRKLLFISLALGLVLATLMPAPVLAAKPTASKFVDFNAGGFITGITDGIVKPAGSSGRFIVQERDINGVLSGDIGGTSGSLFTLSYKANVALATQAGNLHGTLKVDSYSLEVNGTIEPLGFVPVGPYLLPLLTISGQWTFIGGAQGNGDFIAYAVFVPDEFGHVLLIVDSGISMTGKWKP